MLYVHAILQGTAAAAETAYPEQDVSGGPAQRKSRAEAKLDNRVVADLPFFDGPNRSKKHRAAILLAEGNHTERQIARELNIARSTLQEWKDHPDFIEVQREYEYNLRAEVLRFAIASKIERVRQLDELNQTYWQVKTLRGGTYAAAAQTPEEAARSIFGTDTPPWAATGMYVAQPKIAANGKTVTEWAFDKALDAAIKETLKQAAQETGQDQQTLNVNHSGEVSLDIMETAKALAERYGTTTEEVLALASQDDDE